MYNSKKERTRIKLSEIGRQKNTQEKDAKINSHHNDREKVKREIMKRKFYETKNRTILLGHRSFSVI